VSEQAKVSVGWAVRRVIQPIYLKGGMVECNQVGRLSLLAG
jgi:hypothetical protein